MVWLGEGGGEIYSFHFHTPKIVAKTIWDLQSLFGFQQIYKYEGMKQVATDYEHSAQRSRLKMVIYISWLWLEITEGKLAMIYRV